MDTRKANLWTPLILSIAAISAAGCELAAAVDRSLIDEQTGASSGAGGMGGGTGASSSSMSAGGAGGGCTTAVDCPDPMNECVTATCTAGACGTENVMPGTAVTMQTTGDCKVDQCDGNGAIETVNDDMDLPADDGMQCTAGACNMGMPEHNPVTAGTACTENNGKVCTATGTCVECNIPGDCLSEICMNNTCVQINECSLSSATDMTNMPSVTVNFGGGLGNAYMPKCLKVSPGAAVTFNGNFMTHPLLGGEVVNAMKVPASSGPFVPITNTGMSAVFTMPSSGTFPYYCDVHALGGMTGVIFIQ